MRITQARTTAKKVLTLNDIKGVDLSSAPLSVKPTRASYMKNMICKGGVNHKRNGFVQAAQFFDSEGNGAEINGIYSYVTARKTENQNDYIIHAGKELLFCDENFGINNRVNIGELADKKSQGFKIEDDFFVLLDGELYAWDGYDSTLPLFDNKAAYVPTTSIGITDTQHGALLEPYEDVNLFSSKRINKLMGQKSNLATSEGGDEGAIGWSGEASSTFYLDGRIDLSKPVTVTARVKIWNDNDDKYDIKEHMPLYAYFDNEVKLVTNIEVTTVFSFNGDKNTQDPVGYDANGISSFIKDGVAHTIDKFQEYSGEFNGNFKITISNENERGVITFTPALPSPVLGEDNITVEYSIEKEAPKIKCACELTVAARKKQLAIVTEEDVVYYSSPSHGAGYFPDKSYIKTISNVTSIAEGDDALIVTSRNECAVIGFNVSEGLKIVPKVRAKYSDVGSISPYASQNLEGDTLILTQKGVFGINSHGVYVRSSAINKELLGFSREDFKQAVATQLDGRYYLFIGGVVYIADARYKVKFHEGERLASSFQYEWWRWELGVPISVLCHNDKMYIGRDDGRVLCLSDGYVDREVLELESGEYTFDGEVFTLDTDINLNGANLEIANAYKKMTYISDVDKKLTEISGGVITNGSTEMLLMEVTYSENFEKIIDGALLFEGLKVFVSVPNTEVEFEGKIETINLEYNAVNIKVPDDCITEVLSFGGPMPVNLYPYVARDIYTLEQIENDGDYYLKDRDGNRTLFYKYDEMTAKLTYDKPVECELHSAVLNLGSDIKEKVLHELCFVPSIDTTGVVQLGFETNKNGALEDVGSFGGLGIVSTPSVSGELDVGALDFNNFTHDTSFARTFKKRLHERGVEFVKFKLASKTADDFSIERLSCIYSYYTR